jgi:hypothetical protein
MFGGMRCAFSARHSYSPRHAGALSSLAVMAGLSGPSPESSARTPKATAFDLGPVSS